MSEIDDRHARLNTLGFAVTPSERAGSYRVRGVGAYTAAELELVFAGLRGGFRLAAQRLRAAGHTDAAALFEVESNWPPAPGIPFRDDP